MSNPVLEALKAANAATQQPQQMPAGSPGLDQPVQEEVAPQEDPIQAQPEEEQGILGTIMQNVGEIPGGIVDGVMRGIDAAAQLGDRLAPLGAVGPEGYVPPEQGTWTRGIMDGIGLTDPAVAGTNARATTQFDALVDDAETITGSLATGVSQFLVGWTLSRPLQAAGMGVTATNMARGAVADFVSFSEEEGNLSTLIESVPALSNPVTQLLSVDADDHWAVARAKNAIEGLLIGAGIDAAPKVIKRLEAFKEARRAAQAGDTETADRIVSEAAQASLDDAVPPAGQAAGELQVGDEVLPAPARGIDQDTLIELSRRVADGSEDEVLDALRYQKTEAFDEDTLTLLEDATEILRTTDPEAFQKRSFESMREMAATLTSTPKEAEELWVSLKAMAEGAPEMAGKFVAAKASVFHDARGIANDLIKVRGLLQGGDKDGAEAMFQAMKPRFQRFLEQQSIVLNIQRGTAQTTASNRAIYEAETGKLPIDVDELFRILSQPNSGSMKNVLDNLDSVKDNPSVLTKLFNAIARNKFWDIHNEFWINSILSGPKTHLINITSNFGEMGLLPVEEAFGSVLRGDFRGAADDLAMYAGMRRGIKESSRYFLDSLMKGKNILDPALHTNELQDIKAIQMGDGSITQAFKDGQYVKSAVNAAGEVIRAPTRMLGAEDEFFKQMNYRARAYSLLIKEARNRGLRGNKLMAFVDRNFDGLFAPSGEALGGISPTRMSIMGLKADKWLYDLSADALKYAEEATFTNPLEFGVGQWVQNGVTRMPFLRPIIPFVRTPTNIYRAVAKRTPIALLDMIGGKHSSVMRDLTNADPRIRSRAIGRLMAGNAVTVSLFIAAGEMQITGSAPRDPDLRRQFLADHPEYSIRLGDEWVQYNRMDPRASILGLIADIHQIMDGLPPEEQENWVAYAGMSVATNMMSKTYAQSVSDMLRVIASNDVRQWERLGWNRAGSYVPSLFSVGNSDIEQKDIRSALDAVMARTPGFSQNVEAQRDLFGEKMLRGDSYGNVNFNPFSVKTDDNDPVKAELHRLGRLNNRFSLPDEKTAQGIDLTKLRHPETGQTAYDRLLELAAGDKRYGLPPLRDMLKQAIDSPQYQQLSPIFTGDGVKNAQANFLQSIMRKHRTAAEKIIRQEFPEYATNLRISRENEVRVPSQGEQFRIPWTYNQK